MIPHISTLGTVIAINLRLLLAFGMGWVAWAIQTGDANWWGLSFMAIVFGFFSLIFVADAVRFMARLYRREKAVRDYLALGPAPKSSDMASDDDLKRAGMR